MPGPTSTALPRSPAGTGHRPTAHAAIDLRGLRAPQSAARRIVRETLAGKAAGESIDDVVLVADELVGNAMQHAGGTVLDLCLDVYPWGLVVEVHDAGPGIAAIPGRPRAAGADEESGRGLFLVDTLASAWGARRDGPGKRITAVFLHQPEKAGR